MPYTQLPNKFMEETVVLCNRGEKYRILHLSFSFYLMSLGNVIKGASSKLHFVSRMGFKIVYIVV